MDRRPGRKPIRSSDHLSHLIRDALSERVANAAPSPYARQAMLARARDAQIKSQKRRFMLYAFMRFPGMKRMLPPVMSSFNTGFSNAPIGYTLRDAYLAQSSTSFSNPILSLMR